MQPIEFAYVWTAIFGGATMIGVAIGGLLAGGVVLLVLGVALWVALNIERQF